MSVKMSKWWESRKIQYIPEGIHRSLEDVLSSINEHKPVSAVKQIFELQSALKYLEEHLKEDYKTKEADSQ